MKRKGNYWWLSVLSIVLFVGVWWLCCDVLKMTKSTTLPGPVTIVQTFIKKLTSTAPDGATLPQHIMSSLKIAMGGWAMGVIIGTPLGIFMAWYEKVPSAPQLPWPLIHEGNWGFLFLPVSCIIIL